MKQARRLFDPESDGVPGAPKNPRLRHTFERHQGDFTQRLVAQHHLQASDFLALGLDMLPSPRADLYRAKGMPIVAWTVRSPDQWEGVRDHCDNLIFEGFTA